MARMMKDSGIEWIGEIPENWEVTKAKYILSANDGGVWGNDPANDGNDKIVIRSTEQTIDGKWCIDSPAMRDLSTVPHDSSRVIPGDLLITKSSGSDLHIGKTTLANEYFESNECYFSNFIQRVRCKNYLPKLLWYLFNSNIAREQFVYLQNTTSGIGNINADIIDNLFLPNPPVTMQQRIVDFLDRKCAEIDAVIEKTKATIEEYKKLKQSVITEAVTKGVRNPRPMKDSGIEWIGVIPEEWDVVKATRLIISTQNGLTRRDLDKSDGHIVLKLKNITASGQLDYSEINRIQLTAKELEAYQLSDGDFLFVRVNGSKNLVGKCAIYHDISEPVAYNDHIIRVRLNDWCDKRYFQWFLLSDSGKVEIDLHTSTAAGQFTISSDGLRDLHVILPPLSEQTEVVEYLHTRCAALDTLIAKKTALLTELETYKKSLIYEYVTGKKEVCV